MRGKALGWLREANFAVSSVGALRRAKHLTILQR
jgi:hypothetical protein